MCACPMGIVVTVLGLLTAEEYTAVFFNVHLTIDEDNR